MTFLTGAKTGLGDLEKLHAVTHNLIGAYDKIYGMTFPPLAYKLLLFKFVTELSLPRKSSQLSSVYNRTATEGP